MSEQRGKTIPTVNNKPRDHLNQFIDHKLGERKQQVNKMTNAHRRKDVEKYPQWNPGEQSYEEFKRKIFQGNYLKPENISFHEAARIMGNDSEMKRKCPLFYASFTNKIPWYKLPRQEYPQEERFLLENPLIKDQHLNYASLNSIISNEL